MLLVFAVPHVGLNLWRLGHGRSWAFSFCHVMKEWEQGERDRIAAAREARRASRPAVRPGG